MSDDIKTVMMDVAKSVADRAKAADQPPFAEQIDALKALTAMYIALRKHPDDNDPDQAGEGFNFATGVQPEEDPPDERTTVTSLRARRRPG